MLWTDPKLTLISLLTVPLLFAATTWFRKGARKGYDLVRRNREWLAIEVLVESESTFLVRALGVHEGAEIILAEQQVGEGEGRLVPWQRFPGTSVDDPPGDGPDRRRSLGDRELVGTTGAAAAIELVVAATARSQDKDTVRGHFEAQTRIETDGVVIECEQVAARIE